MEKYSDYKDSAVEWLGDIPKHWKNYRVDWISAIVRGNTGFRKDELLNNGEYVALQYGKTYKVDEVNNTFQFFVNSKFYKKNQIVHCGDTILISTSETLEDLGHSCFYNRGDLGLIGGEQILLKPNSKFVIEKYLYYYSKFFCKELRKHATGLKVFRFNIDDLKNILILIPSIKEQTQIANFLDTKTTAIDHKIKLLQQKIKHYKAYRKTLINETVTKGLDKTVQLKDSGIDWIGQIPEHWEVKRIKDVFSISRGRAIAKTELKDDGKYPVYSSQTKNNGILGYINTFDFNANLLTWTTDGVNAGTVFIREGKFNCTNICGTLLPNKNPKLSLEFMTYAVQESTQHNKRIDTNGAKIMSNEMAVIYVVFPPLEEQKYIAIQIESKTTTIDSIVKNIETQITTLIELRKTLINEVVTGKVKVSA